MSKDPTFFPEAIFVCPFCRLLAGVGTLEDGSDVVAHNLPKCSKFEELGYLEYLIAVRRALLEQRGHKPN